MSRIERLAQALGASGVDAYFAQTSISLGYLTGFAENAHERFLTLAVRANGESRLIAPALSAEQARRSGIEDVRPWKDGEDPLALFSELAADWQLRSSILAVDDAMPARMLLEMQSVLPAALFQSGQRVLGTLQRQKDAHELDAMDRAARIADDTFLEVLKFLRAGLTELEVGDFLSQEMRKRGGKPTFAIVGTGPNGAEPHHLNDGSLLQRGDVVILDFGCEVDGYQSDITRTVAMGEASDKARNAYQVVLDGHLASRKLIAPGVPAGAVDAGARDVIAENGLGDYFIHRTGHGIGMQGHEEPYIIGGSEVELMVGDCFSIEPGVYLPGKFGIRIENIVTVTPDGHRSLNDEPETSLRVV